MSWESIKKDDVRGLERFIKLIAPHHPIYADLTVRYIQKVMSIQKAEVWKEEDTGITIVFKTAMSRVGTVIKERNRIFIMGIPEGTDPGMAAKTICEGGKLYNEKYPGRDMYVAIHHVGCLPRMKKAYDYILNKIGGCEVLDVGPKKKCIKINFKGVTRTIEEGKEK